MFSSSKLNDVSSSSSKSSISAKSSSESITVTIAVSFALIPSAITVPFLITSFSSTFNSETLDNV